MTRNAKPSFSLLPLRGAVALALCALLGACAVGPDYQRPALDIGASLQGRAGRGAGLETRRTA